MQRECGECCEPTHKSLTLLQVVLTFPWKASGRQRLVFSLGRLLLHCTQHCGQHKLGKHSLPWKTCTRPNVIR